jgi:hypothetical protein
MLTGVAIALCCLAAKASGQSPSPTASPAGSVVPESISPNGRYGVFVVDSQKEDAKPKNLLVHVEPFQVVTAIDGEPFLKGYLKNSLAVSWARDSSAVLVIVDGYWGINALQLVDLRKPGSVKQTDLLEAMVKISKRELHFWPHFHVSDTDVKWEISNGRRLRIACDGDTESNNLEATPSYMHFEGVWNLDKTKWDMQKCRKTKAPDW